eukprot:10456868-Alexandrium_andersonii.AAC.1
MASCMTAPSGARVLRAGASSPPAGRSGDAGAAAVHFVPAHALHSGRRTPTRSCRAFRGRLGAR